MEQTSTNLIPEERIESKILLIRKQRVMLDKDLAMLYEVPTKVFNQAVKRNIQRFPADFMFQLTKEEADSLRSQFVTLKRGQHSKYLQYAFTEHGILMLSSVLNSERAIQINIQIMRAFARMRQLIAGQKEIWLKIEEIEQKYGRRLEQHDSKLHFYSLILDGLLGDVKYINELLTPPEEPQQKEIGFRDRKKGE